MQHASGQGVSDCGSAVPCASRRLTHAHAPAGSVLAAGPQQEPPAGLLSRFGPAEQGPSRHPRRCALVASFITDSPAMLSKGFVGGWLAHIVHTASKWAQIRSAGEGRGSKAAAEEPCVARPACRHCQHECSMWEERGMLAVQVQGREERSLEREVVLIEMSNQAAPRGSHKQPQGVIIALAPCQTRSIRCRGI